MAIVTPADPPGSPFAVRDCALITLATGVNAQNLKEFRQGLKTIPAGSIDHHLWGRLLRPQFDEPEYNNDFASWVCHGLHDKILAERLSMVVPTDFEDLEGVRRELLEVVEQRLDESELIIWTAADQKFQFLLSQTVIFDTGLRFNHPMEIVPYLPTLSTGSIFYHFIDARGRTRERTDDFSAWLRAFDGEFEPMARQLCGFDPYFSSLKEIRHHVTEIFTQFFAG